MAAPWEKYKTQPDAAPSGPWSKYQARAASQIGEPADDRGILSKGLEYAGRVLDYPGGIARTALAGVANIPYYAATGRSINKTDDVLKALKGQAPTSAEYMTRAGVPEGEVSHTPVGNISTRDIIGFGADVATDPLTALSKAGKLGANVIDKGAVKAGTSVYKSGLKKIDQAVVEKGAKPLSDLLLEKGVSGSVKNIREASENILKETKAERNALYKTADEGGALIDPAIALADAMEEAKRIGAADPSMKDLSEKLQTKIQAYIDHGPVPVSQASEWKTNLYTSMPESAYDKFGRLQGPAKKIEKMSASGLKNEIVNTGNAMTPGLGDAIDVANDSMKTLLSSRKPLQRAAKSAKNVNAVTSVDMMLGAGTAAASHSPVATAGVLAAKKLGDISKTTGFRTTAGRGLKAIGETGGLTPAANRLIIQSPWLNINKKDKR